MTDDSADKSPTDSKTSTPAPEKSAPGNTRSSRATLLILLNILAVTILLVLAFFIVRWPQMTNDNVARLKEAATEQYTAENWKAEAQLRAKAADSAVERVRVVTFAFYAFSVPAGALLLANVWFLFVYHRRLKKARQALT